MANVYMGTDVEEFIFGEATFEEACKKEEVEAPVEEPEVEVEESVEEPVEEEVEVTDEEMNAFGVIECVDDPEVACYRIALENEQNYNMIMNAFMMKEFSVLESTGVEMVYEAADVKKFFTLIKETIARWWSKIQGVIKEVVARIDAAVRNDMGFVKKYKNADIKTPANVKEFKGFDFSKAKVPNYGHIAGKVGVIVNMGLKAMTTETETEMYVAKFNSEFKKTKNEMRALACGNASGSVSESDFTKELQIALFGSEEKETIALRPFADLLRDIEGAKLIKASAKRAYKEAEKAVKELHKEVKKTEAAINRERGGMKIAKSLTDSINATLSIMSRAMSMDTRAMMTKLRQDRAMAVFYVANQPKAEKKEVKESTTALDDMGIVLI